MPELLGSHWMDLAGYTASALVFLAFYMKTMIPLRIVGIASNLAFITYAVGAQLYPVLILHAILLPLNSLRLLQMWALIRKVREASHGDLSMEWLIPFMRRRTLTRGEILFKRGDRATEMYVTLSGSIRLVDVRVTIGAGSVLGEIGVFGPTMERMDTAVCETDVELGAIDNDKVWELYHQNPKFGRYLMTLVIQRLLDDYAKVRDMRLTVGSEAASGTLARGAQDRPHRSGR
jgi:CRP/FNR family cyclic AMP-dependent transcriptional regulator